MEKLEHTPISDKVKEEEEERLHALSIQYRESQYEQIAIGKDKIVAITASLHAQVGFEHGYRAAKAAERPKAWNEAIDTVKDMLVVQMEDEENEGLAALENAYRKLEDLKHKQP